MFTSAKSLDLLATGKVTSGPTAHTLCLSESSTSIGSVPGSTNSASWSFVIFPLDVIRHPDARATAHEGLPDATLEREDLTNLGTGVLLLPLSCQNATVATLVDRFSSTKTVVPT